YPDMVVILGTYVKVFGQVFCLYDLSGRGFVPQPFWGDFLFFGGGLYSSFLSFKPTRHAINIKLNEGLQGVYVVQVLKGFLPTLTDGFFAFAKPNPWVIVFFIGYILSIRIADLALEIGRFSLDIVPDTYQKCILEIGIDVHFDYPVAYGFPDLFQGGT